MQSGAQNNQLPDVSKTKEPIVDFCMKVEKVHTPLYISGAEVEQVNSFGINTENLSWTSNIFTLVKKI